MQKGATFLHFFAKCAKTQQNFAKNCVQNQKLAQLEKISTDGVSRFFHLCPDSFRTDPKINIKRMFARGGLAPLAKAIGHSMPTS